MRRRLTLMVALVAITFLGLPLGAMAKSDNAGGQGKGKGQEQVQPDDAQPPEHCDESPEVDPTVGNGNDRCPENPPCDADKGKPATKSPQCEEGPPGNESCFDDIDNDGDGLVDEDDPDCQCPEGTDADSDGICDPDDNCPETANPGQEDTDDDGIGDACEACPENVEDPANESCPEPCPAEDDADGDGICDDVDNCPDTANPNQEDTDNDGIGDACEACPENVEDPANESCPVDPCTAAAGDPGILTDDTLGQTLWDGGADALSPLTEDPDADGAVSGAIYSGGDGTELEFLTDEIACLIDLAIDPASGLPDV